MAITTAFNGFEKEDSYLDYESFVLNEIMKCEYAMAQAVIDAWVPEERLRVEDEDQFREDLRDLLAMKFARL